MHSRQKGVLQTYRNKHDLLTYCYLLLLVLLCLLFSFVSSPINFNISVELPFVVVERYISISLRLHPRLTLFSSFVLQLVYQRISFGLFKTPLSVSYVQQSYAIVIIDMFVKTNNQTETNFINNLAVVDVQYTSRSLYQVLPNCYFLKLLQSAIQCSRLVFTYLHVDGGEIDLILIVFVAINRHQKFPLHLSSSPSNTDHIVSW